MIGTLGHTKARTNFGILCGWTCLAAGVLGALSGIALLLIDPAVSRDRYSYPLSSGDFAAVQAWFFIQHFGLLAGQIALLQSGVLGRRKVVTRGQWVAIAGMLGLAATELLAVMAAKSKYPSDGTYVLDALYTFTTIAIGGGLIAAAIGVLRTPAARRAETWITLALGGWVFVPMIPAIIAGFTPARLGISGWMLLYAVLGWALVRGERPTRIST
ncbi:MAG: hypothetical protein AB7T37_14890 [Dehalococcoidia bacterium]